MLSSRIEKSLHENADKKAANHETETKTKQQLFQLQNYEANLRIDLRLAARRFRDNLIEQTLRQMAPQLAQRVVTPSDVIAAISKVNIKVKCTMTGLSPDELAQLILSQSIGGKAITKIDISSTSRSTLAVRSNQALTLQSKYRPKNTQGIFAARNQEDIFSSLAYFLRLYGQQSITREDLQQRIMPHFTASNPFSRDHEFMLRMLLTGRGLTSSERSAMQSQRLLTLDQAIAEISGLTTLQVKLLRDCYRNGMRRQHVLALKLPKVDDDERTTITLMSNAFNSKVRLGCSPELAIARINMGIRDRESNAERSIYFGPAN